MDIDLNELRRRRDEINMLSAQAKWDPPDENGCTITYLRVRPGTLGNGLSECGTKTRGLAHGSHQASPVWRSPNGGGGPRQRVGGGSYVVAPLSRCATAPPSLAGQGSLFSLIYATREVSCFRDTSLVFTHYSPFLFTGSSPGNRPRSEWGSPAPGPCAPCFLRSRRRPHRWSSWKHCRWPCRRTARSARWPGHG